MTEKKVECENFKYFIECYFNWSMDFSDLDQLIDDYKKRENSTYIEGLTKELKEINEKRNWNEIRDFIYLHGNRVLNNDKTESMVTLLLTKLLS
ncbi:contact-dependent growth inhibition system immunity protein [Bacillus nakamurai]|uniref:contact-dependent growth inhibition system immunity protein n=1 Tax=Bacillus nakamurai TaxID=1793963 RepID=UPI001E34B33B|nr:contact-dependent growth inhibition system immunity protein [Bacillus nakamurai]MCC9022711.1 hypothetical protein [Bacillus nakamurai]